MVLSKSQISPPRFFFFFFVIWKFNPVLWVLCAASAAWLPEQLRWRRPWKCRHCQETWILRAVFSHTPSSPLCAQPLRLCFITSLVWWEKISGWRMFAGFKEFSLFGFRWGCQGCILKQRSVKNWIILRSYCVEAIVWTFEMLLFLIW